MAARVRSCLEQLRLVVGHPWLVRPVTEYSGPPASVVISRSLSFRSQLGQKHSTSHWYSVRKYSHSSSLNEQNHIGGKSSEHKISDKVLGLSLDVDKSQDLHKWYTQVLSKSELLEYHDVNGCYILRPWSFTIWERIREFVDVEIKKMGVENAYFPLFVSSSALETEKEHVENFAPEVAWVTRVGKHELSRPIALRPTSETVIYPALSKWIRSRRDLPMKLNQWCNVVRWEFQHPRPFLRSREFLWQEGHTVFVDKEDAEKEVMDILDLYRRVYEELLSIPVICGRKTDSEKFAGAEYTTTVEAYIPEAGRGIQAATSHHLGQNFSKMFQIQYQEGGKSHFVFQNSWGLTTRSIGVMVMVHGDNHGLVLPPKVAGIQVVIIPCGVNQHNLSDLFHHCHNLESSLLKAGLRAKADLRQHYRSGWKFNEWELKGVPLRLEVGPRELADKTVVAVLRHTFQKSVHSAENLNATVHQLLQVIQQELFERAKKKLNSNTALANTWEEFCHVINGKRIVMSPFCGHQDCETDIKTRSIRRKDSPADPDAPNSTGAKALCIPFDRPRPSNKCVCPNCERPPQWYTLFGRSY